MPAQGKKRREEEVKRDVVTGENVEIDINSSGVIGPAIIRDGVVMEEEK